MRRQGEVQDFPIHQYKNVVKKRVETKLVLRSLMVTSKVKLRLLSLHSSITNPLSLFQKEG